MPLVPRDGGDHLSRSEGDRADQARYIAVQVDQDARPDLSNRYEDYGWPATIVFNTDGSEIVKRQGYIPPKPMASMLQAIIDDPSPGPSIVPERRSTGSRPAALALKPSSGTNCARFCATATIRRISGWGTVQKFLDWDIIEYCLREAMRGDTDFEQMARETLDAQTQADRSGLGRRLSILDRWRLGASAFRENHADAGGESAHLRAGLRALERSGASEAAKKIRDYLRNFLTSPDGAFYTSQDADLVPGEHSADYFALDDAERRKRGIPRVDQHIYARENGWAINALATLYGVTGDESALADAIRAAEWIVANRSLPGGGFRHDAEDAGGPYLGDSIYMARAFLKLYAVTGDRIWLGRAEEAAQFVEANSSADIGYVAFVQPLAGKLKPKPQCGRKCRGRSHVESASSLHGKGDP